MSESRDYEVRDVLDDEGVFEGYGVVNQFGIWQENAFGQSVFKDESDAEYLRDSLQEDADREKPPLRTAVIKRRPAVSPKTVAAYLPANYQVIAVRDHEIIIQGRDNAGWTLDGYVIPRLASGLIGATEVAA